MNKIKNIIFPLTKQYYCDIINNVVRGVAQIGSALPWGGRGRGFKSRHSDQLNSLSNGVTVQFERLFL